ncbi:sugar ABC transporter permease [Anaerolineae bacterium CFX7]|nr:sugar ABC transporter permease [Anaerolineae bacterium CFX7]
MTQSAARAPIRTAPHKRRLSRQNWERIVSILILLPSIIALGIFIYAFIGWTGFISLTAWNSAAPDFTFVGLQNYARLFVGGGTDMTRFHYDIRNEVGFLVLFVGGCLVTGFLLATLLDRKIRGESIFRSIFLFPMAISFIVTGVAWRWILTPGTEETGWVGVNLLLTNLGLGGLRSAWFTDPTVFYIQPTTPLGEFLHSIGLGFITVPALGYAAAITSIVIAAGWQMSGYTMALYLAGIRSIPDDLREAARVDGASEWEIYRHVIIPLLKPVTLTVVIILAHIALKIFDLVYSMTGGVSAGFATDVPALNMWKTTFDATKFAQGASIAIILLLMVGVLIIPYLVWQTRQEAQ